MTTFSVLRTFHASRLAPMNHSSTERSLAPDTLPCTEAIFEETMSTSNDKPSKIPGHMISTGPVDEAFEQILEDLDESEKQRLSLLRWEYDQSISWETSQGLLQFFRKPNNERMRICRNLWNMSCVFVSRFWVRLESLFNEKGI